jgi:ATP-dependent 26S proteasome regulatory subunit
MDEPSETTQKADQPPVAVESSVNADELETLIRARYPLIYVVSWEEQRVLSVVCKIAASLEKKVFEWSVTTGLVPSGTSIQSKKNRDTASQDPLVALNNVIDLVEPALYVFKDFHPFLTHQNIAVVRRLREIAASLKNTYKTIVIVSPILSIPPDLEKDVTVVDFDLPRSVDHAKLFDRVIHEVKDNPKLSVVVENAAREKIVQALLGLTLSEAENVLAKTLVQERGFGDNTVEIISGEKKQIIRKSGLLEYYDSHDKLDSVGGMDSLKAWLVKRSVAFTDRARQFGLPSPRGILLLGVQGCGKSLMAKAISQLWGLPLLRFDVGRVFGSLVGSSEENIRRAIKVAESVAPTVLWIDEIDKAFRGSRSGSSNTDSGTSARVFGTFLTWMAEKNAPVFVVATANDVSSLPPELLRKGRFDEIFFVDLPAFPERKEIFRVHLRKRNRDEDTLNLDELATAAVGFSGSEIEESIVSALFDVFSEGRELTTESVLLSIKQTAPLSRTMSEDIEALREWAQGRTRMATSPECAVEVENGTRKLEI